MRHWCDPDYGDNVEKTELKTDKVEFEITGTDGKKYDAEFYPEGNVKLYVQHPDFFGSLMSKELITKTAERVWLEVELPIDAKYATYRRQNVATTIEHSVTFRTEAWSYAVAQEWQKTLGLEGVELSEYTELEGELVKVTWYYEEEL